MRVVIRHRARVSTGYCSLQLKEVAGESCRPVNSSPRGDGPRSWEAALMYRRTPSDWFGLQE